MLTKTFGSKKHEVRVQFGISHSEKLRILCMVKVKVELNLCFSLTEHHAMKASWGSGGIAPLIL